MPYLLLLPALILELLIHIVPMIVGVVMSFFGLTELFMRNWRNAPFIGLQNYRVSLDLNNAVGKSLLESFGITLAYTIVVVALSWAIGFCAALVLQGKVHGKGFWRTLFLVPYALPIYAGVITWMFMFRRDTGLVNHLLVDNLHLLHSGPFWLIGNNSFISLVVVEIWRMWPFAFLMLMAGMQNISNDLFEAASLDGAGIVGQVRSIVLPMLRPVNLVLVLVMFLWTFNEFNVPFILFGGSPPTQGDILSLHIYGSTFTNYNFGLGSAQSVLLLLFLLVVSLAYLGFTRRGRRNAVRA